MARSMHPVLRRVILSPKSARAIRSMNTGDMLRSTAARDSDAPLTDMV